MENAQNIEESTRLSSHCTKYFLCFSRSLLCIFALVAHMAENMINKFAFC